MIDIRLTGLTFTLNVLFPPVPFLYFPWVFLENRTRTKIKEEGKKKNYWIVHRRKGVVCLINHKRHSSLPLVLNWYFLCFYPKERKRNWSLSFRFHFIVQRGTWVSRWFRFTFVTEINMVPILICLLTKECNVVLFTVYVFKRGFISNTFGNEYRPFFIRF